MFFFLVAHGSHWSHGSWLLAKFFHLDQMRIPVACNEKNPWDPWDPCGKHSTFNTQHSTLEENGFTKLHQAGVSPALFSGFRPGRGKSPSDEMDSKMHPALWAAQEEWIQQELQGVQSPASILYFLPFGRTLIFISENRWISVSIGEHRWVGKMKCCIFALWFRKRSRTRISRIPRIFFIASKGTHYTSQ